MMNRERPSQVSCYSHWIHLVLLFLPTWSDGFAIFSPARNNVAFQIPRGGGQRRNSFFSKKNFALSLILLGAENGGDGGSNEGAGKPSMGPTNTKPAASGGGEKGGGDSGSSSGGKNGAGGDSEISKALDLIRNGLKLYHELDSKEIDEHDRELQEALKLQRKHNATNGEKGEDLPEPIARIQEKLDAFHSRARWTRIVLLRKIAAWAFDTCNQGKAEGEDETRVDRDAFYSGILLVHLHLAKYVGVAACNPPVRDQIDELFLLADSDGSGDLNKEEFTSAVVVAMAPITSRIAVYYAVIAMLPLLVGRVIAVFTHFMDFYIHRMPRTIYGKILGIIEWVVNNMISVAIFSILVPYIFGRVDRAARQYARKRSQQPLWWLKLPISPDDSDPKSWLRWLKDNIYYTQDKLFSISQQTAPKKENDHDGNKENDHNDNKENDHDGNNNDRRDDKGWSWAKLWPNIFRRKKHS